MLYPIGFSLHYNNDAKYKYSLNKADSTAYRNWILLFMLSTVAGDFLELGCMLVRVRFHLMAAGVLIFLGQLTGNSA
jgi:hypothetical protein